MSTDPPDFVEFASGRSPQLFRSAYLLAGDWHLAEDLVQTTLGKLYASWRRVQHAENPVAYAHTVLFRTFISHRRLSRNREIPADRLPDGAVAAGDPALRLALLSALGELSSRDRAIIVLRYWEDHSIEDTAAVLGLRSGAVRTRSMRALRRLRALLGNDIHEFVGQ